MHAVAFAALVAFSQPLSLDEFLAKRFPAPAAVAIIGAASPR